MKGYGYILKRHCIHDKTLHIPNAKISMCYKNLLISHKRYGTVLTLVIMSAHWRCSIVEKSGVGNPD